MSKNLLTAAIGLIAVLLGISVITFTMTYFAPGDKALAIAIARYPDTPSFAPEVLQGIRAEFFLDEPFWSQYFRWFSSVIQGDFGLAYASRASVWVIFKDNIGETVELALVSLVFGLIGAFALSCLAVLNQGRWIDKAAVVVSSIGAAMPGFWLALLLILVFAANLGLVPAYGTGTIGHLVLPASTLAFWVMASQTRLLRSFMLDAYDQPFIETLRLRGVSEREIFIKHVLRHAWLPALTMIGLDLAHLLEGTIIIELIFARGGVGSLLAGSVLARDLPIVMFLVLFFATSYVLINTIIDGIQAVSDPRRRNQGGQIDDPAA